MVFNNQYEGSQGGVASQALRPLGTAAQASQEDQRGAGRRRMIFASTMA